MTLHAKGGAKTADHPETGAPAEVSQGDAYQLYFRSGFYDRRYPSPNRSMWRRIERKLSPEKSVLDFGCGSGRYLLRLRGLVRRAIGFDVSPAALETLRQRADAQGWGALVILGPDPAALDAHVKEEGPVDLVLCLFGVVGHITDPDTRAEALVRMRKALKPGSGRLLISVPNRARRFRAEQAEAGGALVRYERHTEEGARVVLDYQLFDPPMLVRELSQAGFTLRRMSCESVLPETWLLHNAALRWLDGLLTPWCPTRWGYGIYAEASC
ncbi:MAG: class I SAM-dependent methyltransferase [Pseudomonadota bacterium]